MTSKPERAAPLDRHAAGTRRLRPLFRPSSVAVLGASPDVGKPGGRCLRFLLDHGYPGRIMPVTARHEEIAGLRCYPTLDDLPIAPDLVVLLVPAAAVVDALEAAARCGGAAAVVCASGFAETGAAGRLLEDELRAVAERTGLVVLGPNSLGLLDLRIGLTATFATTLQLGIELRPGPVAVVSQSGAMGGAMFALGQLSGVPVGCFVSTGNEAVVGFAEYVEYLAEDPEITTILGYVEGVRDGRRLVAAAIRARENGKVVAMLNAGRSDAGAHAARSHTGALAGDAAVYETAFRRAGIVVSSSPHGLLDVAVANTSRHHVPGNRFGIVTMSGGAGTLIADRCADVGLEVARLDPATRAALGQWMPAFTAAENPLDVGGIYTDPDALEQCMLTLARAPDVDGLLVFVGVSPLILAELRVRLPRVQEAAGKRLFVGWLAGPPDAVPTLRAAGVAAFDDPIRAVDAAAAVVTSARPALPFPAEHDPDGAGRADALRARVVALAGELDEEATRGLLAGYRIPFVQSSTVTSAEAAVEAAVAAGGLVAVKATGLLHKSDSGGVALNLGPEQVADAFDRVRAAGAGKAVLVQPMAAPGMELIAGAVRDPDFGPVVMVGFGGVLAEVLADTALELAPLTRESARAMLGRLRGAALLGQVRGRPAPDVESVVDLLVELGRFAVDAGPGLSELDLNPIVVYPHGEGCLAVDAAAVISRGGCRVTG